MNNSEILKGAKKFIEKPENWIQGDYAQTSNGDFRMGSSEDACKFCSIGAIQKLMKEDGLLSSRMAKTYLNYAAKETDGRVAGIANFNDRHTHEEVMKVWDKAIAAAEKDETQ